jgi:signal transduction histidine kinase
MTHNRRCSSKRLADQGAAVAMIAHELRNPLAVMSNTLEVCRDDAGVVRLVDARKLLKRQLRKVVCFVDDLMDISGCGRSIYTLNPVALDLSEVIREAAEDCTHQFRARRQTLVLELPVEAVVLQADALRLEQLLVNLLDNSSKFTPASGEISINLGCHADQAVVRVRDNGCGIPSDQLSQIFEPFFRARPSSSRQPPGLGLGLALARRIVQMHYGSIEAHSAGRGCGSELIVRLPLMAAG